MKRLMAIGVILFLAISLLLLSCSSSSTTTTTTTPSTSSTTSAPASQTTSTPRTTTTVPTSTTTPTTTTATQTVRPTQTTSTAIPTTSTAAPTTTTSTAKPTPTSAQKPFGGTLKIISTGPPLIGYPPQFTVGLSSVSAAPCLERLAAIDTKGQFVPTRLTLEVNTAQDLKSITLKLRKGVKFHDGTDFNAEAAKWNLQEAIANKNAVAAMMTSIDVLDDYTIRINLKGYDNSIVANLPYIISPTAFQKNGLDWARMNPVGTGPFKFVKFERDVSLKYTRFDNYWGGKPYLDGVEFLYIADPLTRSAALQSGAANAIHETDLGIAHDLETKGFKLINSNWQFFAFFPDSTNSDSPFASKSVREALEYSIDKVAIVKALGYGMSIPLYQPAPPDYVGYNADLNGRTYSVEKAKQLLAQAGYAQGFKTDIWARIDDNRDALTAVQFYLGVVGIKAEIQFVDNAKWSSLAKDGWKGLLCSRWAINPTYISSLNTFTGPRSNFSGSVKKTPEFTAMLESGLSTADYAVYKTRAEEIVKYLQSEALVTPLWTTAKPYVLDPSIHDTGFFSTGGFLDWTPEITWIEPQPK